MNRSTKPLLIMVVLLSAVAGTSQSIEFKPGQLTPKGRAAFTMLSSTCVFRVGSVGYASETPQEELALYDLLEEDQAIAALKSLVATGSYEGGLYGLLGLSIRNHTEFNRAVEVYKARKERPECQASGVVQWIRGDEETVRTQRGCIFSGESRNEVVRSIQSGRFDKILHPKYRPSN